MAFILLLSKALMAKYVILCDSVAVADNVERFLQRDPADRFYESAPNPIILLRAPTVIHVSTLINEAFMRHLFRGAISDHLVLSKVIGEGTIGEGHFPSGFVSRDERMVDLR